MHKQPRHIRDVFAAMPVLRRFSERLADPAPFSEDEREQARAVLEEGAREQQGSLRLSEVGVPNA